MIQRFSLGDMKRGKHLLDKYEVIHHYYVYAHNYLTCRVGVASSSGTDQQ